MREKNDLLLYKEVLGQLFVLSNRMRLHGDQLLSGQMTIKQWLLTVEVVQFGEDVPTLSDLAESMNMSHQNAKQLALQLHKEGYLLLRRETDDLRATRVRLTEKCRIYLLHSTPRIRGFLSALLQDLPCEERESFLRCLEKLYQSISGGVDGKSRTPCG